MLIWPIPPPPLTTRLSVTTLASGAQGDRRVREVSTSFNPIVFVPISATPSPPLSAKMIEWALAVNEFVVG
jgi:hypothetical protein